uniref:Uncharacterized protein n=1 Tax=Anguilla anguilla TaxID=7936 RepID=A0A0E9QPJ6_ANGAN
MPGISLFYCTGYRSLTAQDYLSS